jgi:hypothetical protein
VLSALKKDRDVSNPETGRDLAITINRDQNNKPVVSSIVAQDSTLLSEDAEKKATWLADTRTWEDVYSVRTYDYLEIIVKGGVPAWDKEAKKFVDKASLKAEGGDNLDAELTVGVENVKANVKAATTTSAPAASKEEGDDLPF